MGGERKDSREEKKARGKKRMLEVRREDWKKRREDLRKENKTEEGRENWIE